MGLFTPDRIRRDILDEVVKVVAGVGYEMCQPHQLPKLNPRIKEPLVNRLK